MSSETVSTAARGRPREFSADDVLDALVQLFWERGYEATSMADIVAATGLSKSSLYNSFGSKDELFGQAVDRYVDQRTTMVTGVLTNGESGLDDIHALLDGLEAEVAIAGDHRGCLAINTSAELGLRDERAVEVGSRFRSTIREGLTAALRRAAARGEVDPAAIDGYAAVLLSFIIGTAVIVRAGAPTAEVIGQLDAARSVIDGWRLP